MSIGKDGKLFSTLSDPIYAEGKLVKEIWISNNGVPTKIYPIGAVSKDYWWYVVNSTIDSSGYDYHIVDSESKVPSDALANAVLPCNGYAHNSAEANVTGQIVDNRPDTFTNQVKSNVVHVYVDDKVSPNSISDWFSGFRKVHEWHNLNNLDISNCISFRYAFSQSPCSASLSTWFNRLDTSKVQDFSYCFYLLCSNAAFASFGMNDDFLAAVGKWNISNAKSLCGMFQSAVFDAYDPLNYMWAWDVSNVEDFSYMFRGMYRYSSSSLTHLDLSKLKDWKPISATNFQYMFYPGSGHSFINGCALSNGYLWADENNKFVVSSSHGNSSKHLQVVPTVEVNSADWSLHIPQDTKVNKDAFNSCFGAVSNTETDTALFAPAWYNQGYRKYDETYDSARAQLN